MKISVLGSGSKGNATFIDVNGTKILIDAGFSCKKIEEKLVSIGENIENISALLLTHEHADHIAGAGIISRKYEIPIYITRESFLICEQKLGKITNDKISFIDKHHFIIDNKIKITPFDVMHDAVRTVGFKLEDENAKKISISTDIGFINNVVREHFKDVDAMIIESNYDFNMLMNSDYPWGLKDRIKSRNGHLSNNEAAKFIKEMSSDKLKKVFLAHISKDSNSIHCIKNAFIEEFARATKRPSIEITNQDVASKIFEIK